MEMAKILNTEDSNAEPITVMFNPPSMKLSSSNTYADMKNPGSNQDRPQFIKNNSDILTVDLFFDTTYKKAGEDKSVRTIVKPILDLAKVAPNKKEPPKLKFAWGDFTFDCVIVSIDHNYEYFTSSGIAQRATLSVKFRRVEPVDMTAKKPSPKSLASVAKAEVIKAGQDLTCFCVDPKDWAVLAELNKIDNPFKVSSGDMIGVTLYTVDSICK